MSELAIFPSARRDRLVIETLKDEILIYDLDRDQASCLNATAAMVWKFADGKTGVAEIASKMAWELGSTVDVRVVWYALQQLDKKHLLVQAPKAPAQYSQMTRRDFLMKAGIVGAGVAIPVIISLAAPTPAMASACSTGGCTADQDCVGCPGRECCDLGTTQCIPCP